MEFSVTLRPFYSRVKSVWNILHRRLCGSESLYGRGGEDKNPCPRHESNQGRPAVATLNYHKQIVLLLTLSCYGVTNTIL